jgi:hypothetical protein
MTTDGPGRAPEPAECSDSTEKKLAERLMTSSRFLEFVRKLAAAQAKAEMASVLDEVRARTEFMEEARLGRKARRRERRGSGDK